MRSLLFNKFEFHNLELATVQKQTESNICGLFAIAVGTAIAYDKDPSDMHFVEHKMRGSICASALKRVSCTHSPLCNILHGSYLQ